ncbi:hypothetical protein K8R47_03725 [archaeon]|nr:hypothetical protein [archaeon]
MKLKKPSLRTYIIATCLAGIIGGFSYTGYNLNQGFKNSTPKVKRVWNIDKNINEADSLLNSPVDLRDLPNAKIRYDSLTEKLSELKENKENLMSNINIKNQLQNLNNYQKRIDKGYNIGLYSLLGLTGASFMRSRKK